MPRRLLLSASLVACLGGMPLRATTLFTDLSSSNPPYNSSIGHAVSGSATANGGFTEAMEFTVAGSGSKSVGQLDFAVTFSNFAATFNAAIFTVGAGKPGVQVANASWTNLPDTAEFCCSLVTVTGITGVTLTGGTSYYMVLSTSSTTASMSWDDEDNSIGVSGDRQYSNNGGVSWTDTGVINPLSAFDVLSGLATPEPAAMLSMGCALGLLATLRMRRAARN